MRNSKGQYDKGNKENVTHGMTGSSEERIYRSMKQRCYNSTNKRYSDYGGRGITICDRWKDSFTNFYSDMGPRPSKNHSIDRFPDTNGNYEPNNCRWATMKEQALNKRDTVFVNYQGEKIALLELTRKLNLKYCTIRTRLTRGKMSLEDALIPDNLTAKNKGISKPINQYTYPERKFMKTWSSIKDASRELNLDSSGISKCARGKREYVGNYVFQYQS